MVVFSLSLSLSPLTKRPTFRFDEEHMFQWYLLKNNGIIVNCIEFLCSIGTFNGSRTIKMDFKRKIEI